MKDLFDNKILCNECGREMKKLLISKNGFNLRAARCDKCGETILHPQDKIEYENFVRLKQKEFNVKMRMVGNSYAVSIPREIVDFMHEQEENMNNMVRLCFEDFGKISMKFNNEEDENVKARVLKSREVRVVRNGKPIYHSQQVYDSTNPKNNHTRVFKEKDMEENNGETEE